MKRRVLVVLLVALAGTLLAGSAAPSPAEETVSVIEPMPTLPSDGGQ